jgi:hypothetical protein
MTTTRHRGQAEVESRPRVNGDPSCTEPAATIADLMPATDDPDQKRRTVDMLICMTVSDLPVQSVPSFRDACDVCGTALWRSNSSAGLYVVPECVRCARKSIRARQVRGETPVVRVAPYSEADLAFRDETR